MSCHSDRPAIGPVAPTPEDLERAYAAEDERLSGHGKAEDVLCDGGDVIVLCTVTGTGGRERTVLVRLDGQGDVVGRRSYGNEHGAGRAIAALPHGGFVVAGEIQLGSLEFRGHLMSLDTDGDVTQARTIGQRGDAGLSTVAVLADGSPLAGGAHEGRGWLVGERSECTVDGVAEIVSIAADADGGFMLAAVRERSTTALGLARLASFGADRSERWARELPETGRGELASVATVDGDTVALGHREPDAGGPARLWCVRLDRRGGAGWDAMLTPTGGGGRGRAVAPLPGGHIAVAGDAADDQRRRLLLARLDADGATVWQHTFAEHDEVARGLVATPSGDLIVAGSTTSAGTGRTEPLVRRVDGEGTQRWARTLGDEVAELQSPAGS